MKVLAGLVTQGTGSIGGMTMSKNKQGYYLRSRTVPSNPQTISQTAVRNGLSALASNWTALTQAQRDAWNLYSKNVTIILNNGQTKVLSGFNWYVGANQLRLVASESIQNDAPTTFTLAGTPMVLSAAYVAPLAIMFNFMLLDPPSAADTGDLLLIQLGRPQTTGTLYFTGPWQFEDTVDSFDSSTPVILPLAPDGIYPAVAGQNQWLRVTRILPDGRYSTPVHYGPITPSGNYNPYGFGSMPIARSQAASDSTSVSIAGTTGTLTSVSSASTLPAGYTLTIDEYASVPTILLVPGTGAVAGIYPITVECNGSLNVELVDVTLTLT